MNFELNFHKTRTRGKPGSETGLLRVNVKCPGKKEQFKRTNTYVSTKKKRKVLVEKTLLLTHRTRRTKTNP